MKFNNLESDTECNCREGAEEQNTLVFARKISKNVPKIGDFRSHWERGKRPQRDLCYDICMHKGLSINAWNQETKDLIIDKYVTSLKLQVSKNTSDNCILLFKFKEGAGVVVASPTVNDPSHYTFYKSDNFDTIFIEQLDIIELKKYLC